MKKLLVLFMSCILVASSFTVASANTQGDLPILNEQQIKEMSETNPKNNINIEASKKEYAEFVQETGFNQIYVDVLNGADKSGKEIKFNEKTLKKFQDYMMKVDKFNKKRGHKSDFDVDKIRKFTVDDLKNLSAGDLGNSETTHTNQLNLSAFATGDIALPDCDGAALQGLISHAAIFDKSKFNGSYDSRCFLSANNYENVKGETNVSAVLFERPNYYKENADRVYACYVKNLTSTQRETAYNTVKAVANVGDPYSLWCIKSNKDEWYCSKVPWYGYSYGLNVSIDWDGGPWVWPVDIYNEYIQDGSSSTINIWNTYE
jgi:hypothetical protein